MITPLTELAVVSDLSPPAGSRLAALFSPDGQRLIAVHAGESLQAVSMPVGREYPALSRSLPSAQAFERDLYEQHGIVPVGHPWLKPLRLSRYSRDDFYQTRGAQVHEVAVGPVHAGVIEPGHFRFQCNGEHVLHLEIALGYTHRGVERALAGGPDRRTLHYFETLAGDTSVGHALAGCRLMEELAGCQVPARGWALRELGLELERLANHVGDLGALAGDVAFQPAQAACGRLRGAFLNLTAELCGSRLGRGLVRPGGSLARLEDPAGFAERARGALGETRQAVERMLGNSWVRSRLEDAGRLTQEQARELGLLGPSARACQTTGDVDARARVRSAEVLESGQKLEALLADWPAEGPAQVELGPLAASHLAVSLVEGWRGTICHAAVTDEAGKFAAYKVVDPSMLNWMGLALALRGQEISDFPLCNKSFNLSYCGHDL